MLNKTTGHEVKTFCLSESSCANQIIHLFIYSCTASSFNHARAPRPSTSIFYLRAFWLADRLLKHGSLTLRRRGLIGSAALRGCEGARACCILFCVASRGWKSQQLLRWLALVPCTAETPLYITQSKLLLLTARFSSQPTFCFKKQTLCLPEFSFILCLGSLTLCGTRREIFRHLTLQCQQEISGDSDQDPVKTKNRQATEL